MILNVRLCVFSLYPIFSCWGINARYSPTDPEEYTADTPDAAYGDCTGMWVISSYPIGTKFEDEVWYQVCKCVYVLSITIELVLGATPSQVKGVILKTSLTDVSLIPHLPLKLSNPLRYFFLLPCCLFVYLFIGGRGVGLFKSSGGAQCETSPVQLSSDQWDR